MLVHYLQEKFRDNPRFSVQHADVLKADLTQWGPVQVAGNLPVLHHLANHRAGARAWPEPAARCISHTKGSGRADRRPARGAATMDCFPCRYRSIRSRSTSSRCLPEAFKPPPQVDSAVIQLLQDRRPSLTIRKDLFNSRAFASGRSGKCCAITLRALSAGGYRCAAGSPSSRRTLSVIQLANLRDRILKFQ